MLHFLKALYSESHLNMTLIGDFQRKESDDFEHFTESQKQSIETILHQTLNELKHSKVPTFGLETYLNDSYIP